MLDVLDLVKEIHTKIAKFASFTSLKDAIYNEEFFFQIYAVMNVEIDL